MNEKKKEKVSICCMSRNEDVLICEFVAYYILIGIDHVYIYDDQSIIPVSKILAKLMKDFPEKNICV